LIIESDTGSFCGFALKCRAKKIECRAQTCELKISTSQNKQINNKIMKEKFKATAEKISSKAYWVGFWIGTSLFMGALIISCDPVVIIKQIHGPVFFKILQYAFIGAGNLGVTALVGAVVGIVTSVITNYCVLGWLYLAKKSLIKLDVVELKKQ